MNTKRCSVQIKNTEIQSKHMLHQRRIPSVCRNKERRSASAKRSFWHEASKVSGAQQFPHTDLIFWFIWNCCWACRSIKKKWTEENLFEQQFLMQTKEVNKFTTQVKNQHNKQDATSSPKWQLYWYHWYLVSRSMPKMLKQVQHDKDIPFMEMDHIPSWESHSGISLILCCSFRGKD